jgi:hypothetical protein
VIAGGGAIRYALPDGLRESFKTSAEGSFDYGPDVLEAPELFFYQAREEPRLFPNTDRVVT